MVSRGFEYTALCLVHRNLSLDNANTMRGTLPRVCVMHVAEPLTCPRSRGMGMGMGIALDTILTSGLGLLFLFLVQMLQNHRDGCNIIQNGNQGVTKGCRLSWLTNSVLVYEPKCGGEGGVAGSQPMGTAVHWSPNKLWRTNSIYNL
jgi:hypothetical protein